MVYRQVCGVCTETIVYFKNEKVSLYLSRKIYELQCNSLFGVICKISIMNPEEDKKKSPCHKKDFQ